MLKLARNSHGLKRGTLTLTAASVLAQVLMILATPALTARYSPEHFGVLGVFNSYANLVVGISCLRYEQAIPLAEDERKLRAVSWLCLISVVACTSLTGLAALSRHHGPESLGRLLPLSVLIGGMGLLLEMICVRRGNFLILGSARISQVLVSLPVQLFYPGTGAKGLILGQLMGGAISLLWIFANLDPFLAGNGKAEVADASRRFLRFPLFGIWSSLAIAAAFQLPIVLLNHFFGNEVAGWYSLSQKLVGLPCLLLAESLARAFLSRSASLWRRDIVQLKVLFFKVLTVQCVGATLLGAGVYLLAPFLFRHWLGDNWLEAGSYSQMLVVGSCLSFVSTPFEPIVDVTERQHLGAIRDLARFALLVAPIPIGHSLGWNAIQTIASLSGGLAIYSLISLTISTYCLFATPPAPFDQDN